MLSEIPATPFTVSKNIMPRILIINHNCNLRAMPHSFEMLQGGAEVQNPLS